MKSSWLISVIIVGIVISVLVVLNYQQPKESVPIADLLQDENKSVNKVIEYEFMGKDNATKPMVNEVVTSSKKATAAATTATVKNGGVMTSSTSSKVVYAVQVSSFSDKAKADKVLATVQKVEPSAFIASRNLGDKGTWYRVYAGKFETRAQAEELLVKLKKDFPKSFIISTKF